MKVLNTTPASNVNEIPENIRRLVASPLPRTGNVHLLKTGNFALYPDSLICELRTPVSPSIQRFGISGFGIDGSLLTKRLEELGASGYVDGSPRQRVADSAGCADSDFNIYYAGFIQDNRDGEPYRLVLTVWQANHVWAGGIERSQAQLHPNAESIMGGIEQPDKTPPLEAKIRTSVQSDARDLTAKFVQTILLGAVK